MDICEGKEIEKCIFFLKRHISILAWAIKHGFLTAKASRPDVYRAANHILRLALQGRINLYLRPPDFTTEKSICLLYFYYVIAYMYMYVYFLIRTIYIGSSNC